MFNVCTSDVGILSVKVDWLHLNHLHITTAKRDSGDTFIQNSLHYFVLI